MAKSEVRGSQTSQINALDMSGGIQCKTTPALVDNNQVMHMLNADIFRRPGGIAGRYGSITNKAVGKNVDNIMVRRDGSTKNHLVIAKDTTEKLYKAANNDFSGTHTEVTGLNFTADESVYSTTFAQDEMIFNGVDNPQRYDGSSLATITNAPAACKYPEVFNQTLYALGTDGFLHYSDVINTTGTDFTSTTWYKRGINPNDGQRTRALIRHRARLVIFKDESIYRYDGSNEPEPIINVGTHSEKGATRTDRQIFFHHPSGIYEMSLGDPQLISYPVQKFLDGMNSANWDNVAAGNDGHNVFFWIGDVTIDDQYQWDHKKTYSNVVLVYNIPLQRWMVWTNIDARAWFYNTDTRTMHFITSDQKICALSETSFSDSGTNIDFEIMWAPISYGAPQLPKKVDDIFVIGDGKFNVSAGSRHNNMEHRSKKSAKYHRIQHIASGSGITFYELYVMINSSYKNNPPFIEQLVINKANVGHHS
jgi:hypothetical protein